MQIFIKKINISILKKIKLYPKKILKNEVSIQRDRIIICEFSLTIFERSFTGKTPEEISVKDKFNESKALIEKIFKTIKIISVRLEYKKRILIACFKISELSNDMKLVNVF